jgi:hypothetical protein
MILQQIHSFSLSLADAMKMVSALLCLVLRGGGKPPCSMNIFFFIVSTPPSCGLCRASKSPGGDDEGRGWAIVLFPKNKVRPGFYFISVHKYLIITTETLATKMATPARFPFSLPPHRGWAADFLATLNSFLSTQQGSLLPCRK